jgi:hypothetical protein
MTRHRTPVLEIAVVLLLVAASVIFVLLKRRPGNDEADARGPRPESAGLSWQWHTPGAPGATTACQVVDGAAPGDARAGRDGKDIVPRPTATWRGATVDCLALAGVSWDERWQNLAEFSLKELADASLGVRSVPQGEPPLPPPDMCTNEGAHDLVAHLVRCALPAADPARASGGTGRSDLAFCGEHATYPGGFGLAREWLDTPLKDIEGGRERVSACLMAHASATGQQVRLRLETARLDTPVGAPWPALLEGAFAGNLFPELDPDDPRHLAFGLYACQADGYDASNAPPGRVCTLDAEPCGFERTRCDNTMATPLCEQNPVIAGPDRDYFARCRFPGAWQAGADEIVTVYVTEQERIGRR